MRSSVHALRNFSLGEEVHLCLAADGQQTFISRPVHRQNAMIWSSPDPQSALSDGHRLVTRLLELTLPDALTFELQEVKRQGGSQRRLLNIEGLIRNKDFDPEELQREFRGAWIVIYRVVMASS